MNLMELDLQAWLYAGLFLILALSIVGLVYNVISYLIIRHRIRSRRKH